MNINAQAPVQQAKQILIAASPEKIWSVLTNVNNWVKWNKKITQARMEGPAIKGARFRWTVNGAKINSEFHTVEPFRTLGWSGTTFGGSAIHNWVLEPREDQTLVKVEESMEGWLIALFKTKMNRDLERDMEFWLEKLKLESEKTEAGGLAMQ